MKRLCTYNGLVAAAFLAFCSLLVIIEVKIGLFRILGYAFLGSTVMVFPAVYFASRRALHPRFDHPQGIAAICALLLAPIIILLGVVVGTNLKFLIGGHI
jgi:hypothetical protein